LSSVIKPGEHIAISQVSDRSAAEMLKFIKDHGLEGAVAKRSDSVYQPGQRTGLWSKYRVNLGQEFTQSRASRSLWRNLHMRELRGEAWPEVR
jgi:bifunctional non-homologous end joining protein LigD